MNLLRAAATCSGVRRVVLGRLAGRGGGYHNGQFVLPCMYNILLSIRTHIILSFVVCVRVIL